MCWCRCVHWQHARAELTWLLQIFAVDPHPEGKATSKDPTEQESVLRHERDRSSLPENSRYLDVGKIAKEVGMARTFAILELHLVQAGPPYVVVHSSRTTVWAGCGPPYVHVQDRDGTPANDCRKTMCEYLKRLNVETALIEDATLESHPPTLRP